MPEKVPKKSSRIATFDILRGYFLCVILFNHLQYYPSGLDLLTGRGVLYVSSAEGFFLLSGIVLGIVRGQKLIDKSFALGAKLLIKRAAQLYVASIVLVLLFTFVGWLFIDNPGLKAGIFASDGNIWEMIWRTLTLNYLFGWTDFLRLYVLFIAASPIALWLLRRGWWYIVLGISGLIWALYPSEHNQFMLQPWSWQFVFFSGFVIGFHWQNITNWWRRFSPRFRKTIGVTLVSLFLTTAIASVLLVFAHLIFKDSSLGIRLDTWHHTIEEYFSKDRLPIPRLILGAIWFWALFWLTRRYESFIIKWLGWLLIPLGTNSLYVYIVQGAIVFTIHLFIPSDGTDALSSISKIIANLALSLFCLGLIYFAVRTKFLMKIIPR